MNEPAATAVEILSEELGESLSAAVEKWYHGDDLSLKSWQRMMRRELAKPLTDHLSGVYSSSLRSRGIAPLSEQSAAITVLYALRDTEDIRKKLLSAPSAVSLVASPFFWQRLVGRVHQVGIVSSLLRVIQGIFGQESVDADPRYTGRVRWNTAGPDSRHRLLDGQVRDAGDTFNVNGFEWTQPRQDASNGPQASGCLCWLSYERVDGTWG